MEYYIPPNKELYYSVDEKKVYLTRKGVNNWVELPKILFPELQYQFVHFLSFLPKYQNLT